VHQARPGYTLFEIILVLALIVVLTTLVYPSLDAMYGQYRLTQAADMVRAAWATARAHAMDEGRPYRFAVVPNKGNFRVAPDSSDFWGGQSSDSSGSPDSSGISPVSEDALPKGVRFATADAVQSGNMDTSGDSFLTTGTVDPGTWSSTAVFLPDGTARDDVEITFYARNGRPVVLRLRALTGAAKLILANPGQ